MSRLMELNIMANEDEDNLELREAAYDLYMSGRWMLPAGEMPVEEQAAVWERLRDALGLKPGHSTRADATTT